MMIFVGHCWLDYRCPNREAAHPDPSAFAATYSRASVLDMMQGRAIWQELVSGEIEVFNPSV